MKSAYYEANPKSKTSDFLLGFFLPIGLLIVLGTLAGVLSQFNANLGLWISSILFVSAILWLLYLTFSIKRFYVGVGMLVFVAITLVLGGGCFLMIRGWH